MTRSNKMLIGVLLGLGLIAAYWFLLLAPKREEAAALESQLEAKQSEVAQAEATLTTYRAAQASYKATYSEVSRLGKAVPVDDDVRSLVVQLDGAAGESKVDFRTIELGTASTGSGAATTAGTTAPPPGAVQVGSAGFSVMPFVFRFKGEYANLSNLFNRLEQFVTVKNNKIDVSGRLVRLESIELLPDGDGYPKLTATVNASTYIVPSAQGVAGGSTSSPTAPSTSGGTAAATTTGALR